MCDTELTRQRFWLGSAAALMSAVSFSSNVALSKLAYDFGTNLHALNLIRASVFLGCLIVAVWFSSFYKAIRDLSLFDTRRIAVCRDVSVIGLNSFYPSRFGYTRFLCLSDNDCPLDLALGAK